MGGPGPFVERMVILLTYYTVTLFLRWVGRVRVVGKEHIPSGGGVLFLANHISALDVFFLPWVIYGKFPQDRIYIIAKEELLEIPLIGWWLSKLRAFPIKRGKADLGAIRTIEEFIRNDKVLIFPEGTRSLDGKLGPGNRMVGRFIRAARPTVIPVGIKGTNGIVPVGKKFPRRGAEIEVVFGPPLELGDELAIENTKESSVRIVEKAMATISTHLDGSIEVADVLTKASGRD
ncbi:MAG: 1-acyl-sn-glycerol-3-phosphate acyltransferase [Nitrospinaceae bacterium]|jgi:1-acyl-sn-glycerol-3-phosphate acyltransferase|nr:1-acyl-sn-glycerol-3-phosphate acyltransferase [Nitrospinaceae bacterium]MBT3434207.1 1-acyl-sn-glycerol-3-phosphate acyltransferase [Nitrospinaceae bacterium]MBT3820051.1 1-acyl-sn-glycerol-3-phosphate acyltransferase [Nitrospinaceae bacterium]MBT4093523.1 1-acyl-sn-glycerol-3-phosphate acyltransferase [Nitrospinaceae bacterium]MBT4431871.1 1-acyl-sn-glycerol-3-phosphate acyltransferase [Nitrospinaceae bacterium]